MMRALITKTLFVLLILLSAQAMAFDVGGLSYLVNHLATPPIYDNAVPMPEAYGQTFLSDGQYVTGVDVYIGDPTRLDNPNVDVIPGLAELHLYDATDLSDYLLLSVKQFDGSTLPVGTPASIDFDSPILTSNGQRYAFFIFAEDGYGLGLRLQTQSTYSGGCQVRFPGDGGPITDCGSGRDLSFAVRGIGFISPDAPTIDSIELGNGEAIISFTSGVDNGSPITGYRYIKDDGSATSTIFGATGSGPLGIAMDAAGNVYTANYGSNNVSKITPDGISSILGTTRGNPAGIALDAAGNVYTANSLFSDNVSKITPDGTSTIFGTTGTTPLAIAIDAASNIYAANYNSDTVSKITPEGISTILGTTGNNPKGIAIDAAGNIYTANGGSDNVSKITPDGSSTIFGTTGSGPFGIAVDAAGNVYTANYGSANVSKITPDGTSIILGTTGNSPEEIAVDAAGNVYTANYGSATVAKITPEGISTILGTTGSGPFGIAIDAAGNVYTTNNGSNNVSKITDASVVTYPATGDTSPITITGLTNDTEYLMSLIAVNAAGESVASNSVSVTPATTAPDAPTIDSIALGDGQVVIAVTPGADNGLPITGYTAVCLNTISDSSLVSSSTSPITVSGLTNGVSYVCVVSAANGAGNSQRAEASSVIPSVDTDGDGVNDLLDNCVSIADPGQEPSAINPSCGEACVTSSCAGTCCDNH